MNEHFLVTGARRGLGLALTGQLLQRGCTVSVIVRTESEGLTELRARHGERLSILLADVTNNESIDRALNEVAARQGHLDAIINNAVIYLDGSGPILENVDLSIFARTFEVNSVGPLRVAQYGLPLLRKGKRKLIVNVSSEAGSVGDCTRKAEFAYCMSKSALNMGTKILHNHVKSECIQVMALHPGWFNSSGEGPAPISAEQAAAKVLDTILKPREAEDTIYLDSDGKSLPW